MKKILAALCIVLFAHSAANADVMKAEFTHQYPNSNVASVGSLTLALNSDGTINAHLNVANNQGWYGVAIDSGDRYAQTAITKGSATGWGTGLGSFNTGLVCSTACAGPVDWTIGTVGEFTSVAQAFAGQGSAYDAWFYSGSMTQYAGMMAEVAPVPEPATLALLGLGFAGAALSRRKRSK